MWCRTVDIGAHHPYWLLLHALFIAASVPTVTSTTATMTMTKGLFKPMSWERHGLKHWIDAAKKRLHRNFLAIALANKLARIAWVFWRAAAPLKRASFKSREHPTRNVGDCPKLRTPQSHG